jgi:hypothetical protein
MDTAMAAILAAIPVRTTGDIMAQVIIVLIISVGDNLDICFALS